MKILHILTLSLSLGLLAPLAAAAEPAPLRLEWIENDATFVLHEGAEENPSLLKFVARDDFRPYFHPLRTPDGKGVLTEFSPGHHRHQTGLYWGLTRVNGRDYFHHPGDGYWRREAAEILDAGPDRAAWRVAYHLINESGDPMLLEEHRWTFSRQQGRHVLDLDWSARSLTDVTIGKYNYGGLFLRSPWRKGIEAQIVNSRGEIDKQGEGRPAEWVDLGIAIEGSDQPAHVAMIDHPQNPGHPIDWRIDGQFGFGPAPARRGDIALATGKQLRFLHRLVIYHGAFDRSLIEDQAQRFATQKKPAAPAVIDRGDPRWKMQPKGFVEVDLEKQRMKGVRGMDAKASLKLLFAALMETEDTQTQASLLKGISLGLEGQRNFVPPEGWRELSARLNKSGDGDVRKFAAQVSQIFGDESAIQQALAVLKDPSAKIEERRSSLASLVSQQRQDLLPVLPAILDEDALRLDAIRAFSVIESPKAAEILIDRFSSFDPEAQRAAVESLAGRKSHAQALLAALEAKKIPREAVPVYTARTLSDMLGEAFSKNYGVAEPSGDKKALIGRYKKLATPSAMAKADAAAGRAVFQQVCFACHKMYNQGGIIGPDLTGSNRADLDYLLLNIIDPSGDIPDSYRMTTIQTNDGQVLVGTVVEEDPQKIVLNMIGTKKVIGKADVKSRTVSNVSMMPEGLLQMLKEEQVLNLFKYLQTQEQVSLP